ncbi:Small auxin-up RNA [Trema orientale]|uniref:Small auxin-up RNA n=1 Tax=Trema orientale TaxID=63057 RepID=A0A2P5FQ89_TREOI|nr:Small auxin-up RNA [Trema orientale]
MSPAMGRCNKIRHIVRIRQMLQQWRRKARIAGAAARAAAAPPPSDVPAGHVAVCVGSSCRRFIVRATHLNHPMFKNLLVQAEEEYGFANHGPLSIPCDEASFEEVLRVVTRSESGRHCHVDIRKKMEFFGESRPLLHDLSDKSVC